MKLGKIPVLFMSVLGATGLVFLQGCGGGSGANVITVNVSASSTNVIVGTSVNLTATVNGATTNTATWGPCQFTTTPTTGTNPQPTSPANCPTDGSLGTLSNSQTATAPATITYTAPNAIPDQTKYPNLKIIITATSTQDTKKTGSIPLTLNSGISVVLTPITATVPTKESQQFGVSLTNDLQSKGVTWLIMQPTSTVPIPTGPPFNSTTAPSCHAQGQATDCGSIDTNGLYTAPPAIPVNSAVTTPADLTVIAYSNADNTRFATGTITVIQGGPVTFNGITPTIAPQGAAFWDLYLDAPNISSSSIIFLNFQDNANPPHVFGQKRFDSVSTPGQIKILFPIPTSTTANPTSSGARLRLLAQDLTNTQGAASVLVTVTDPAEPVCPPTCPSGTTPPAPSAFTFSYVPVRPTTTAAAPDDLVEGALKGTPVTIDGGYFGPAQSNLVRVSLQSPASTVLATNPASSSARQLSASFQLDALGSPGLYPLYVSSTLTSPAPVPSPNNPAVTNIALFPDYSPGKTQPQVVGQPITAGTNPSAIDIDPTLGILAVAETGSNTVEFFSIGSGSLTSLGVVGNTAAAPINVPTGISIDRNNHTVAVVNYGSQTTTTTSGVCNITALSGQSVTVLNVPGSPSPITPFSVDLRSPFQSGASQASPICPAPMPYSISVDSDSHLALVAYSSTSVSSTANVGFIANLNANSGTNPYGCPLTDAISGLTAQSGPVGQCLFAQVTLNTGAYPHVSISPHNHLALVTPGGSGAVRGVDVTKPSSANFIANSVLSAGLVTVTVDTTKCVPGQPTNSPGSTSSNPCPLLMVPGNAGTALITGVKPNNMANASLFNGQFVVNVTSNNTFTYVVNDITVSDSGTGGTVFYGNPGLNFGIPVTLQGVAINPITDTAALADANSTGTNGPQIELLNGLDQTISTISFFADCTAFNPPNSSCPLSPELLATTDVAWQPFTNELISYNPKLGQLSVSDPVSRKRYARVPQVGSGPALGSSAISIPVSNGTNGSLTLWGGVAVDPATNQAFVVESGQAGNSNVTPPVLPLPGQIQIVDLAGNIKSVHISELLVPSRTPGIGVIGGIPGASVPNATLTCVATPPALPSSCNLAGVRIFGTGLGGSTGTATPQVRLDGVDITTQGGAVNAPINNGREVDVTIPFSTLAVPHHFALDVLSNGVQSNVTDFYVIHSVDFSQICKDTNGNFISTQPTGVAIADQLRNGPFSPIAIVTNTGCGSISTIDLNPNNTATFGTVLNTISVGKSPLGVAVSERFGLAVVTNNGDNTASIVNLLTNKQAVPAVSTGTKPMGVATNDSSGVAITANNGSNTVTEINLAPLFASTPATTLTPSSIGGMQQPIAIAVDPDRGTNNLGIAVVTGLQLQNGSSLSGALYVIDLGGATPTLAGTSLFFSAIPTGIVFDPAAATNTANPGLFYANSSGTNVIGTFNPDSGGGSASVSVGINPTSLAINPQTGAILTTNTAGQSISLVDTLSSPLKTRQTLAIPGSPQFGVAIDQFTNLAVIVDQANNRILLFPMPN